MSTVTNIVLQASFLDRLRVNSINEYLLTIYKSPLEQVHEDIGGGSKSMEIRLHIGAYNYFKDYELELIKLFQNLEWDYPEETMLIITPQEGVVQSYIPKG